MSVVSANLKYATQTKADDTTREYTSHYIVITDAVTDGPVTVRSALPLLGAPFVAGTDSDAFAYAHTYGTIQPIKWDEGGRLHWTAEVMYSTRPPRRRCTEDVELGPLDLPPIIWGGGLRERKPIDKDKDGIPVTNSAGDPFDGAEMDDARQVLNIQLNQADIDEDQFDDFTDAVNSEPFFGLSARKWKMDPPQWRQQFFGNCGVYYEVTYQFLSNRETWDFMPPDRGHRYIEDDGAGGKNYRYFADDVTGQRAIQLGNLDGTGFKQLFLGIGAVDLTIYFDGLGGNPPPFTIYQERDFGLLGIPTQR